MHVLIGFHDRLDVLQLEPDRLVLLLQDLVRGEELRVVELQLPSDPPVAWVAVGIGD